MTLTMFQPLPAGVRTMITDGMIASFKASEPATGDYSGGRLMGLGLVQIRKQGTFSFYIFFPRFKAGLSVLALTREKSACPADI